MADIFEQIGYQQENPGLRNSFLPGRLRARALEVVERQAVSRSSPDVVRAMTTELFLNFLCHPHGQPQGGGHEVHNQT